MTTPMSIKQELEECLKQLERGDLSPGRLRSVVDKLSGNGDSGRQDLLYLQTRGTSVDAPVIGYSMFLNGKRVASPEQTDPEVNTSEEAKNWPYKTVIEAIQDGWRVISFPNLALMMDDTTTHGLGCEFILEKRGS